MAERESTSQIQPLQTRHVFLDTQVYRKLRHNLNNPAMKVLQEYVAEHFVVLHTTDITLLEVERQLGEEVLEHARQLERIKKDFARYRHMAPKATLSELGPFDAEAISRDLFGNFRHALLNGLQATNHHALDVKAADVFSAYFKRQPPFDRQDSKEFPDAFVVEALDQWCRAKDSRMYIVTGDGAMRRAAAARPTLIPVPVLEDILAAASASRSGEAEELAEAIMGDPGFDARLERTIEGKLGDAVLSYEGDLPEGEAYTAKLVEIIAVSNYYVVAVADDRVSLILEVDAKLLVEVGFQDHSSAIYDKEDGIYIGVEPAEAEIEADTTLKVFLTVSPQTGQFLEGEILNPEIAVAEDNEWH